VFAIYNETWRQSLEMSQATKERCEMSTIMQQTEE
jgi:hypothetical protein